MHLSVILEEIFSKSQTKGHKPEFPFDRITGLNDLLSNMRVNQYIQLKI